MRQALKYSSIALLLTFVCGLDCAAKKRPEIPPDPKFVAITSIAVLPAVDSRAGDKKSVSMERLQNGAVKALQHKRYKAEPVTTTGAAGQVVEEDLQSAKPELVKTLGPAEARWVMVVCLGDVISKMTFGSTGNAEVSGYLFDKETGELLWKGKGAGQAGQGGLAGMMMKGAMKGAALDSAVYNLVSTMPTMPKPPKKK